jgi:methionyl aminopeptidase
LIKLKTIEEIKKIRAAGKILARVAQSIKEAVKEGVSLKFLDELAFNLIKKAGAEPAFLGYQPSGAKKPYGYSICASVNEVVVHGIPTKYKLKNGDLLKIDLGLRYHEFYADIAFTLPIGKVSSVAERLSKTTQEALMKGIKVAIINNTIGDIGYAIQNFAESKGFKIIKGLTGHGIGRDLHEDPFVYNEGKKGEGEKLKAGMTLAIEPMISAGSEKIIQFKNDSYATSDGALSAHFEHTIAITEKGPEILTML